MIVCFGSVNLDLIFTLPTLPSAGETVLSPAMRIEPGGKGANQAVAAARDGAAVVFAGAVGRDSLADDALALMRSLSIDTTRIVVDAGTTGCAAICVDAAGRNMIAVGSGANLAARQTQVEDALLTPGTTLLLQRETEPAEIEALIRRARAAGARIVLNLAPAGHLAPDAMRMLDVLVVNEHEAAWLGHALGCADDAAALHAALGADVVVTRGGAGLEAATSAWTDPPARPPCRRAGHHRRRRLLHRRAGRRPRSRAGNGTSPAPRQPRRRLMLHPPRHPIQHALGP